MLLLQRLVMFPRCYLLDARNWLLKACCDIDIDIWVFASFSNEDWVVSILVDAFAERNSVFVHCSYSILDSIMRVTYLGGFLLMFLSRFAPFKTLSILTIIISVYFSLTVSNQPHPLEFQNMHQSRVGHHYIAEFSGVVLLELKVQP